MTHLAIHIVEIVFSFLVGIPVGVYLYRKFAGAALEQVKSAVGSAKL